MLNWPFRGYPTMHQKMAVYWCGSGGLTNQLNEAQVIYLEPEPHQMPLYRCIVG